MVEKRFGKLGLPDIERFENYLPTAFSSELTLLQKVNKIIQDLIASNKLTNEMVDYLNNFIETFDEKLYQTLDDILSKWLEDGVLIDLIREVINEEVVEARTDYLGNKYANLKERLDSEKADAKDYVGERIDEISKPYYSFLKRKQVADKWFGWKTINFIGDSITHGANAFDIPSQSWAGIMKRMLQYEFNTENYGFEKIFSGMENTVGKFRGAFNVTTIGNWVKNFSDTETIGLSNYTSTENGAKLELKLNIEQMYAKLVYQGLSDGGVLKFYTKNNPDNSLTINTSVSSNPNQPYYTFALSLLATNDIDNILVIEKLDNKPTKVLGVQFFNNESDYMIQNYARSGAKLIDLNDNLINKYCDCNVCFFAMGHNDVWTPSFITKFRENISKFITNFKANKTFVIVNDFCWYWDINNDFRKELKRLADETNGIYIGYHEEIGYGTNASTWIENDFLSDSSHLSPKGHQQVAEVTARKLGLGVSSKFLLNYLPKRRLVYGINNMKVVTQSVNQNGKQITLQLDITGTIESNGKKICKMPKPTNTINCVCDVFGEKDGVTGVYREGASVNREGYLEIWLPLEKYTSISRIIIKLNYEGLVNE